jgi:Fur family ferric uptake transcriptional regulator
MTIPPANSRAVDVPNLSTAFDIVRDQGLRLTSSRRLVLEALFAAGVPVGAEQIAAGLDGELPQSDVTSVYRNLETLEGIGIVSHIHLGHGPALYMIADAGREFLHCESCGRFESVATEDIDDLRAAIQARFGFQVRLSHFPLSGRCRDCLSTERSPADESIATAT